MNITPHSLKIVNRDSNSIRKLVNLQYSHLRSMRKKIMIWLKIVTVDCKQWSISLLWWPKSP